MAEIPRQARRPAGAARPRGCSRRRGLGGPRRQAPRLRDQADPAGLRQWRPEAALLLPFSFSSARFTFATGAPIRIGYAHELRSPLLTAALQRPARGEQHLSDEYLALGAVIGAGTAPDPLPRLAASPEGEAAAEALLDRLNPGRNRFAVMAPRSATGQSA
jgi:ADP-heptose:LPS heptosyltransferase